MDLSQTNSFYVTISSDEGVARFPKNRDSDFSVQLGPETVIVPSDWEVGLATFTYRYDFNTLGYDNLIALRYREYFHEITIPVWNCQKVEQLAEYLDVEMNKKILHGKRPKDSKTRPVEVNVDAIKRIRFSFDTDDVDIGFAAQTSKLLGFSDQPFFQMANFQKRRRLRYLVKATLKPSESLQLGELEALKKKIRDNPDFIYTQHFFPTFLRTFRKSTDLVKVSAGSPKYLLFHRLTGGDATNPFRAPLRAEAQALSVPGVKRPSYVFPMISFTMQNVLRGPSKASSTLPKEAQESLRKLMKLGAFVHKDYLDWLERTPYKDLFKVEEAKAFVEKFETQLHPDDRTKMHPDKSGATFSGIFTEAIAAFIVSEFLNESRRASPVLYSNEPVALTPLEQMYVYLDIIKPEPVNNLMSPLLEIIRTEGSSGMLTQYRAGGHLQYKSLEKSNITNIRVLIASKAGERIPFLRGPTELQLHFRKKPKRSFN